MRTYPAPKRHKPSKEEMRAAAERLSKFLSKDYCLGIGEGEVVRGKR